VILHVLYTAEDDEKTLLKVREMLADLDERRRRHDEELCTVRVQAANRRPIPSSRTAVKGYAAMHDRFRTSVQGTARSYLKWLAGEDIDRALSRSDFSMGDLMCAEAPVCPLRPGRAG
jgi:type IV secretion system protein VirD4